MEPHTTVLVFVPLWTPAEAAAYEQRMKEATREGYAADRSSRRGSLLEARHTYLGGR